jgi:hypothetical protein
MEDLQFNIKRSLTDNCSRKLIISQQRLSYEDKDIANDTFTQFDKDAILEYRYGVIWKRLYLTFGREYQIFIRNKQGEEIKIHFKSYFGSNKKKYREQYIAILNGIQLFYFDEITNQLLDRFHKDEEIQIGNVTINKEKVIIKQKGLISPKVIEIAWKDLKTKNYTTNFSIYSALNPTESNIAYRYFEDWNTAVLYSVIRTIQKH